MRAALLLDSLVSISCGKLDAESDLPSRREYIDERVKSGQV